MSITQVVTFTIPPLNEGHATEICTAFHALKQACKKPDGTPYILSIRGGRNCAINPSPPQQPIQPPGLPQPPITTSITPSSAPQLQLDPQLTQPRQTTPSHAFIIEFENVQDRDYYVREDPVQAAFGRMLMGDVGGVRFKETVDFMEGVY